MQLIDTSAVDFGTFEHIVPESHGGTDAMSNLLLAHKKCNGERSSDRQRIPLFCWVRREFGTDELKIVKYLNNPNYAAFAPEGPSARGIRRAKKEAPFDPFARF